MEKTISQFIPMILIFLFLRYTRDSVALSHTVLGKLFAVSLILFYTKIDVVYGLVVCLLVICYYQSDYVEGMKTDDETDPTSDKNIDPHLKKHRGNKTEDTLNNTGVSTEEIEKDQSEGGQEGFRDIEGFAEYNQLYDKPPSDFGQAVTFPNKNQKFIQQHCEHQSLKYKNQPVRPDMAQHIFNEIAFDDTPCNVCSKGCTFVVKYLQQEEDLTRPNLDTK